MEFQDHYIKIVDDCVLGKLISVKKMKNVNCIIVYT